MKTKKITLLVAFAIVCLESSNLFAQKDATSEKVNSVSPISVGVDLVNRYIFRGIDFGESPALQPSFAFSKSGFTIGAWGSYALIATPSGIEADLFTSYDFDFGLSLGVTDYYFPGESLKIGSDSILAPIRTGKYFDYGASHYFELNISQTINNLDLSGNWGFSNLNNALYFEAEYNFNVFNVFVGAGNEVYTSDGRFNVVNAGISATKEIKITENYAFSISTSAILNPDTEQFHLVFKLNI